MLLPGGVAGTVGFVWGCFFVNGVGLVSVWDGDWVDLGMGLGLGLVVSWVGTFFGYSRDYRISFISRVPDPVIWLSPEVV